MFFVNRFDEKPHDILKIEQNETKILSENFRETPFGLKNDLTKKTIIDIMQRKNTVDFFMTNDIDLLRYNTEYIKTRTGCQPETALVLGSGLGSLADEIKNPISVKYSELKDFPVSTVSGHCGKFIFTDFCGIPTVIMHGRVHYYEGYSMKQTVLPIRLIRMLGAKKILLTNAAGGLRRDLNPGTLMMITDHISSFVPSPLIGKNNEEIGTRFPDMSEVYDMDIRNTIIKCAKEENIKLKLGVYLQTSGPNYETPHEIKMYKRLGADAVGMSTACEAVAAVHCGLKVGAISCITNKASGLSDKHLSHEEVKKIALQTSEDFKRLVKKIMINI